MSTVDADGAQHTLIDEKVTHLRRWENVDKADVILRPGIICMLTETSVMRDRIMLLMQTGHQGTEDNDKKNIHKHCSSVICTNNSV